MYYGALKKKDIANGPGVRVSLFVSGCTHHCPGCFNTETWDFEYGTPFSEETIEEILQALPSPAGQDQIIPRPAGPEAKRFSHYIIIEPFRILLLRNRRQRRFRGEDLRGVFLL